MRILILSHSAGFCSRLYCSFATVFEVRFFIVSFCIFKEEMAIVVLF